MNFVDLIPDTLLPVLSPDSGDKNPRRLTLLYKHRGHIVCLLSRGLEEVTYGRPVQDAFLLKIFGPKQMDVEYEDQVTFAERPSGNRVYPAVTKKCADMETKEFKIPFYQPGTFVSEVVDEGLDRQIHDFFDQLNQAILQECNSLAERGLLRTYLRPGPRARALGAELAAVKNRVALTIGGFFHEECDSAPVPRSLLMPADCGKRDYFEVPRWWTPMVRGLKRGYFLLLAVAPSCLIEIAEKSLREGFQKRFDRIEDEQEKELVAMSEFAMANPKFVLGIKRAYLELKAVVDLATFGFQVALTWLAYRTTPLEISLFLIVPTVLTGLVKLQNAGRSGGKNFSGIISTAVNNALIRKHRLVTARAR